MFCYQREETARGTMSGNEQDWYYCTICGGIPPDQIKIKKRVIVGKESGIDRLDRGLLDVNRRNHPDDDTTTDELVKRVRPFNYILTKKMPEYQAALLREYRMLRPGVIRPMGLQLESHKEANDA